MIDWRAVDPETAVAGPAGGDVLPPIRPSAAPPPWRIALEIPMLIVFAGVIAIVVKALLAQAFFIPSASMEPQLTAGDRVVVSRLAYDLHDPRRGDIVVFDDPTQVDAGDEPFIVIRAGRDALEAVGLVRPTEKELIKRVVGLPGEEVSAVGGVVHIDGRPLQEPYLPEGTVTSDFAAIQVAEGHVFVMGDNRTNSKDSRVFRGVPVDSVVGRAIVTVWPPGRVAFL
jgi:signal peptidase I